MGSMAAVDKPHVVCSPYPVQGHINPMFKLAKLLHHRGFHITFVNTEYNHQRLLKSRGPSSVDGLLDFQFKNIPGGLPPSDADVTQDIPSLCESTSKNCSLPFCNLIHKLNDTSTSNVPLVSCIISDGVMTFTLNAAEEFGIPLVFFWTPSACGSLAYMQYRHLIRREMGSIAAGGNPHAVCIPYPAQGHINPMFKLAKLLHHRGFHITFVNTEYNHQRLLKSRGPSSLDGLPDFQFKTIPDGLPPSDADATQDIPSLCESTSKNCSLPFRNLIHKLNDTSTSNVPPVSCIISDGVMTFTLNAAEEFGIPLVFFWTPSACGCLAYMHYRHLIGRGLLPLKADASWLTNGYMETATDCIPGMKNIRLKDLPSFIRTTDLDDIMLNFVMEEAERTSKASAVILNTFDALEQDILDALSAMLPRVYSIGPLQLLVNQIQNDRLKSMASNLWKEQPECIDWLNLKQPNSVVTMLGDVLIELDEMFSSGQRLGQYEPELRIFVELILISLMDLILPYLG
ncbi:hypothetical protein L1049_015596 [Liquidambar formosana]|uniref:Glycosyltransferase N-terminal domain-containing protein n=1 Tax=Liquidambar formosana TaxID=63359 RepID=A0AAP0X6N2_LIQFO